MPFPTPHITAISLLHEVPLDSTYRHTIYFASASAQHSYFAGKIKSGLTWSDCMYHRQRAAIRVNAPIEDCSDVNYAMFQNSAYGSKWFYAFVTEHVYINANCTELKIELDVLQTWYFDYDLLPCFIERCHPSTDVIGENVVAESLSIGEYETAYTAVEGGDNITWDIIAYSSFDWSSWQPAAGSLDSGNLFSGLKKTIIGQYNVIRSGYTYTPTWIDNPNAKLEALIRDHADLVDGLVALIIAPHYFEANYSDILMVNKPVAHSTPLGAKYKTQYVPRNNKLYTAPFTVMMITNGSGAEKMYAFEDFAGSNAQFRIYSDRAPDQSLVLIPEGYKGFNPTPGQSDSLNISEALTLTGYPQCAWVSDAFRTYLAQNKANIGLTAAIGAGKVVAGVAATVGAGVGEVGTAGAATPLAVPTAAAGVSLAMSGVSDITRLLTDLNDASKQPPRAHGQTTGSAFMAVNEKRYRLYILTPKAEYCRIIDSYFDLFGYAQNKIGSVNVAARPHWTYTKTHGAHAAPKAGSGCAAADLAAIQRIFDNGVTFWKNGAEVGDYSLDNSV